jgi:hypothetical protein
MRMTLRFVAALAVVVLLVACGGGDDSSSKPDPQKAKDQAHAALITRDDIGSGWTISTENDFQTADDIAKSASCDALRPLQEAVDKSVVGEGQRAFQMQRGASLGLLDIDVSVLSSTDAQRKNLEYIKSHSSDVVRCVLDGAKQQFGDANVDLKTSTPLAGAPKSGYSESYNLNVTGAQPLSLHYDIYTWFNGNAAVQVKFIGTKDVNTSDLQKSVLGKVEASSNAAFKK